MSAHNDPDGPFGYVPADPWMSTFAALQKAEQARDAEARCLADAVVMPEDEAWRIPIRAEYYRRAAANNDYARGVWEQVCERRGVAA